jgi:hypothetical protein
LKERAWTGKLWVCERLKKMGYAKAKHIRLYGENWRLISNPRLDEQGFVIGASSSEVGTVGTFTFH